MVETISKIHVLPRSKTGLAYIPPRIVTDKNFPFQHEDDIKVTIEGNKLVLEKQE